MSASASEPEERPALEQRFAPWMGVRTTIHPQGLVIEVRRPFSEQMATIEFDRLVLEPGSANGLRSGLLWLAGAWYLAGLVCTLPALRDALPLMVTPSLLVLSVLTLLATMVDQQRVTMFLDREGELTPIFLRGGPDEPEVAAFLEQINAAAIAWCCNPEPVEEPELETEGPRLADTLDRLLDLRARALLSDGEFETFRRIALRP
jgi:hypothetical protein